MGRGSREDDDTGPSVRFCTLADSRYFPGLVALVNSLRLVGHHEPVTVLDAGLTEAQRRLLAAECDVAPAPPGHRGHVWLLEPEACRPRPGISTAEIVVYVDADVIATRALHAEIDAARDGAIVAWADHSDHRWFAEWSGLFALRAPLRREPYVNTGFLAFEPGRHPHLVDRWAQCCERLVGHPTLLDDPGLADTPAGMSSQDALNALLMSEVPPGSVALRPPSTQAGRDALPRTVVTDPATLTCTLDGRSVSLLHAWGARKPWDRDLRGIERGAYLTCLRRLLVGTDVALRVPPAELPRWLRPGPRGAWALRGLVVATSAARPVTRALRSARSRWRNSRARNWRVQNWRVRKR